MFTERPKDKAIIAYLLRKSLFSRFMEGNLKLISIKRETNCMTDRASVQNYGFLTSSREKLKRNF